VLPVRHNTVRALETYNGKNVATNVPVTCRLRNLIRFVFAEVEGCVLIASSLLARSNPARTIDLRKLLAGAHPDVRSRIADTLDEFAHTFASAGPVNRTGSGWDAFLPLRELRNRLTHPHAVHDLSVGSDSLDMALAFAGWWHHEVHPRFDQAILKHARRQG
jgi:hypothetical protein